MSVSEAPAARAFLREAKRRFPKRSCKSDGILPSAAHTKANPTSRHEKGDAADLTHDPENGCDAHQIANWIRQRCIAGSENRIDEIISDRRIATARKGWVWRTYEGSNPHTGHAHFSFRAETRDDTRPFLAFLNIEEGRAPKLPAPTPLPEDDMPVMVRVKGERTVWLTDLLHGKRSLDDATEVAALKAAGVRDIGEVPAVLLADVPALKG